MHLLQCIPGLIAVVASSGCHPFISVEVILDYIASESRRFSCLSNGAVCIFPLILTTLFLVISHHNAVGLSLFLKEQQVNQHTH